MNIKTFIAAAVVALTAACNEVPKTETIEIPADETQAAEVELNDDGSVKVDGSETLVAPVGQPQ